MNDIDSSNSIVNILAPVVTQDKKVSEADILRTREHDQDITNKNKGTPNKNELQERQTLLDTVQQNLDKVNEFLPVTSTNLSFEFDENGDPPFIRVIDNDNEEVIREIPSEEFREVAKALDEFADKLVSKGVLLNETV